MLAPHELYRLLHTGNPGDVEFYVRAAGEAERVLDLGVGWGRIAVPLAERGFQVLGVDRDPRLLSDAQSRSAENLRLILGDIRELEIEETFDRIFISYNTLYALGGKSEVVRTLQSAVARLTEDGEIWFDVYAMDEFHQAALDGEAEGDDEAREEVWRAEYDGGTLVVFERTRLHLQEQLLDVLYEAELDGVPAGAAQLAHHYLLRGEILECLHEAGLEAAALMGGFEGEAADEEAEHLVVCAVRRGL